jgi:hypothetical protein
VHVAGQPIELVHNDWSLALTGEGDSGRQLGPVIIRAALGLREGLDEAETLLARRLLRLQTQARAALLGLCCRDLFQLIGIALA